MRCQTKFHSKMRLFWLAGSNRELHMSSMRSKSARCQCPVPQCGSRPNNRRSISASRSGLELRIDISSQDFASSRVNRSLHDQFSAGSDHVRQANKRRDQVIGVSTILSASTLPLHTLNFEDLTQSSTGLLRVAGIKIRQESTRRSRWRPSDDQRASTISAPSSAPNSRPVQNCSAFHFFQSRPDPFMSPPPPWRSARPTPPNRPSRSRPPASVSAAGTTEVSRAARPAAAAMFAATRPPPPARTAPASASSVMARKAA